MSKGQFRLPAGELGQKIFYASPTGNDQIWATLATCTNGTWKHISKGFVRLPVGQVKYGAGRQPWIGPDENRTVHGSRTLV